MQQLTRARPTDGIATPLAEALRGHLASARGDYAAGARAFDNSVLGLPARVRSRTPALMQYADRLAHADALRALGRADEATRWYQSLRDGPAVWGAPYLR